VSEKKNREERKSTGSINIQFRVPGERDLAQRIVYLASKCKLEGTNQTMTPSQFAQFCLYEMSLQMLKDIKCLKEGELLSLRKL